MSSSKKNDTVTTYKAPLDDIRFVLNEVLNIGQLEKFDAFKENLDIDTINGSLETIGAMAEDILHPLNASADKEGCTLDAATNSVKTPKGFKEAYKQFNDFGLTAFSCSPEYGGSGMPLVLSTAVSEIISAANLSFGLYSGLTHGVYTALEAVGSQEQKDKILPKLVSGEWTGTMCLTEPEAGTDLGRVSTTAEKQADGSFKLTGTKIFISAGDHDLLDKDGNIVHLVLARIKDPSTPEGIKGISLFVVPKFNDDRSRNPVFATRLEEKMGLHGSPTCQMNFDGAVGQLVGQPGKGMKGMFIMMNEERLGVGAQGIGMSEVAYQNAVNYAADVRTQGQPIEQDPNDQTRAKIIRHPDVRRELLSIKAAVEGGRMLAYWTALQLDIAHNSPDEATAKRAKNFVELLTPVIKAHLTDNAEANTSSAVQVYGGHGFIADDGVEQFSRDARILRLYEGANGIQALDLLGRKVLIQQLLPDYLTQLQSDLSDAKARGVGEEFTKPVEDAAQKLQDATNKLMSKAGDLKNLMVEVGGVSTDFLKLASLVTMGHMWVKMVDTAQQRLADGAKEANFYNAKIETARFYMQKVMPQSLSLAAMIDNGATSLTAIAAENFPRNSKGAVGLKPVVQKAANTNIKPPKPDAA
jgi:alkylation response protein AidB-like acyl-CoA dehydrogenase